MTAGRRHSLDRGPFEAWARPQHGKNFQFVHRSAEFPTRRDRLEDQSPTFLALIHASVPQRFASRLRSRPAVLQSFQPARNVASLHAPDAGGTLCRTATQPGSFAHCGVCQTDGQPSTSIPRPKHTSSPCGSPHGLRISGPEARRWVLQLLAALLRRSGGGAATWKDVLASLASHTAGQGDALALQEALDVV